jgi:argininosuccinate synthase
MRSPPRSGAGYQKIPISIDENLWGRSIETGVLEDPWRERPQTCTCGRATGRGVAKPTYVEIEFERGIPFAIDGTRMGGVDLVTALHTVAGENGVGRVDRCREPAGRHQVPRDIRGACCHVLLKAHAALQDLVLRRTNSGFKSRVATTYADLNYNGLLVSAG